MLKELKKMYLEINYIMEIQNKYNQDIGLLYFGKRKSSPDMIVIEIENCLKLTEIKKAVNLLYTIGEEVNCNKFHIITNTLPKKNVLKELAFLNIKVSDYKYIHNLKQSILDCNHIELLPHNEHTLKEAECLLKRHKKVAVVQATGTGKSFIIGSFLVNRSYGKKVVLTPSRHIINQIKKYFGKMANDAVHFLTYTKLSLMSDEELKNLTIDTLILDEFHRAGASKWEDCVRKLITLNKQAYLIGTTATPRRYLDNDRDMVKELFDGISTEEIDVSSAIARGILPNPKYVYSVFDFEFEIDNAMKLVAEGKYKEEDVGLKDYWINSLNNFKMNWSNSKGLEDVIKHYMCNDSKNKFIVFCSNKSHIGEMQIQFKKHLSNNGFVLENEEVIYTGLSNNEKTLSNFENYKIKNSNGVSLLFCIDILSEGVHLNSNAGTPLRGVFLMRNTVSPIIFYQQIGRALASNMEEVPIIFDLTNNCASIKTKFYQYDLEKNCNLINNIRKKFGVKTIDYTTSIDVRCIDILNLLSNIKAKFDMSWERRIEDLKLFIEVNGHAAISKNNADESMVNWAQGVRSRYFRNVLSYEQVQELNQLGFIWDMVEYRWKSNLEGLQQFKDENGFITSITRNMSEEYHFLAVNLRSTYRKGQLSKEKISDLESIGFVWEMEEHRWNLMYKELVEYNKQRSQLEKEFKKPKPQSSKLKNWLSVQKSKYDRGALSDDKIEKLKKENVSFLVKKDTWIEGYNKYLLGISKPKEDRPHYVYSWAALQRKLYSQGKLTDEQVALVEGLGISLVKSEEKFWVYLDELIEYKRKYGTCRVLKHNVSNKKFYSWYANLKSVFDDLSKDKQEALTFVGYERYIRDSYWNSNMELYKSIRGKCPSTLTEDELEAYKWACRLKTRYKKGKLNEEQVKLVKEVILT